MLLPIMESKRPPAKRPPATRGLTAPPASGSAALRLPDPDFLPPLYFDERLVQSETREEMLEGRLIQAFPADHEHADPHLQLDRLVGNCVAPGYTASTDLLTRATTISDFATDTCIRRSGTDPRTGTRYLEELAFEICNSQTRQNMTARARDLTRCGVRRIFAIFVKTREVCEWSPKRDRFITLDLDDVIDDRTLIHPLPVRALFDAAVAEATVVDALDAKGSPRLVELVTESHEEGRKAGRKAGRKEGRKEGRKAGLEAGREEGLEKGLEKGRADALAEGIGVACELLGLPFGLHEREVLEAMDADGRATLLTHLRTQRRWPLDPARGGR